MNLSIPASGISSSLTRHAIAANDIANVNTPGYAQSIPNQKELPYGGTAIVSIGKNTSPAASNSETDLASEMVEIKTAEHSLKANSSVIKVQDRMMGALLDIFA